jgi:membrane-bound lytic murein transglycosylase B
MRIRAALRTAAWALVASILLASAAPTPTDAQPPPQRGEPSKAAEDARKALEKAGREVKKGAQAAAKEVSKAFRDVRDKLRTTQQERRRDQVKDARDKWGALLTKTKVREELRIHSRRMARLNYIESLSDDLNMNDIQDRAKRARDQENDRFDRRMDALKASGGER